MLMSFCSDVRGVLTIETNSCCRVVVPVSLIIVTHVDQGTTLLTLPHRLHAEYPMVRDLSRTLPCQCFAVDLGIVFCEDLD